MNFRVLASQIRFLTKSAKEPEFHYSSGSKIGPGLSALRENRKALSLSVGASVGAGAPARAVSALLFFPIPSRVPLARGAHQLRQDRARGRSNHVRSVLLICAAEHKIFRRRTIGNINCATQLASSSLL